MQITFPPGARVIIETQAEQTLTLAPPPQRRRIGAGPVIAIVAFAAGMFVLGVAVERAPARITSQGANQLAPGVTLPFQPAVPPQTNPFGLKP